MLLGQDCEIECSPAARILSFEKFLDGLLRTSLVQSFLVQLDDPLDDFLVTVTCGIVEREATRLILLVDVEPLDGEAQGKMEFPEGACNVHGRAEPHHLTLLAFGGQQLILVDTCFVVVQKSIQFINGFHFRLFVFVVSHDNLKHPMQGRLVARSRVRVGRSWSCQIGVFHVQYYRHHLDLVNFFDVLQLVLDLLVQVFEFFLRLGPDHPEKRIQIAILVKLGDAFLRVPEEPVELVDPKLNSFPIGVVQPTGENLVSQENVDDIDDSLSHGLDLV
mmetsp:Transcript_4391/g.11244  ORF Transcript_4391/g.11244 Transcript_4391/m.11244 type:complete len:276 (+) Transcript_4391:606-1433(+)